MLRNNGNSEGGGGGGGSMPPRNGNSEGVRGLKLKKLPWGGGGRIFSGTTQCHFSADRVAFSIRMTQCGCSLSLKCGVVLSKMQGMYVHDSLAKIVTHPQGRKLTQEQSN